MLFYCNVSDLYCCTKSFVYLVTLACATVLFSEREWLHTRVCPCTNGMRLAEFHHYLASNGPYSIRARTFTMQDALQLAKSVLISAVRDVDEMQYGNPYPCSVIILG